MPKPIVNERIMKKNSSLKTIQKKGRKHYLKGNRKVLKNYVGKLVQITDSKLIGEENRVGNAVDANSVSEDMLLTKLEEANLLGMSGNGFPVALKVRSFRNAKSDNKLLIVNAVECEPGLKQDEWLLQNRFQEICIGVQYICHALHIKNPVLAVKQNINVEDDNINIMQVPARFPMGEEHFLIHAVTGRMIGKDVVPTDLGILVMNLQTVYQIYKLINQNYEGKRFVTLADLETGESRIAYVCEQDSVEKTIKVAFSKQIPIFAGKGILNVDAVDEKTTFNNEISFVAFSKEQDISNEHKCKGCGQCTRKCPVGIPVHKVVQALEKDSQADISMYHPERCIRCGSCAYFCKASKLPGEYVNRI